MAEFRKKPVVISAFQWQGDFDALDAWLNALGYSEDGDDGKEGGPAGMHEDHNSAGETLLLIPTLEGEMTAKPGDWIIRGVQGEFYPCKPDIFAATYESAAFPHAEAPLTPARELLSGDIATAEKVAAFIETHKTAQYLDVVGFAAILRRVLVAARAQLVEKSACCVPSSAATPDANATDPLSSSLRVLAAELRADTGPKVEDTVENFPAGHDMTERRFVLQEIADTLDTWAAASERPS